MALAPPLCVAALDRAHRRTLAVLMSALALAVAALTGAPAGALEPGSVAIETGAGARHRLEVEIATTPQDLERGLAAREAMAPDHGMLLDFGEAQPVSMWMRDTRIPLDMLFLAEDGRIVGIAPDAVPYSEDPVPSPGPVRAVLELNAGTVERLGVAVGDRVAHAFPTPAPPPTDPRLLRDLAGRWRMEAKERDALVPNIRLVLRPDGGLDLFRDEGGGTNFSLHFWGDWAATSPEPDRLEIAFRFVGARPGRVCYPLPGGCEDFGVPFREGWTFTRTGPDAMETPGAAWRRVRYGTVTQERLDDPGPRDWLMYRGNYQGWGYSPLGQITPGNVKELTPVWSVPTGEEEAHEAPPIVNDGVMFVSTPQGQVIALDAATGDLLWRYRRELPEDLTQLHPTNRGVALWGDTVFVATLDCFLVALDARTGEVLWEVPVDDYRHGYYMTLAPLVAKGRVMVGVSGGEYGIRGYVAAYDAGGGRELWRTHTVPGPGEPGNESWPGDTWRRGGAPVWVTGSYDPATGISYWGTGNPSPWMPDERPGDNLHANSVVSLDVGTGRMLGHHQYHPGDAWDWDEVSAPVLVDLPGRDGVVVPGLVHAGRNGYLWRLERGRDGSISFIAARPFVRQNVFARVDPQTGRPEYDPARVPGVGRRAEFCPGLWGGKNWPPAAYSPRTGLLYFPANENLCGVLTGTRQGHVPGERYTAVEPRDIGTTAAPGADHVGEFQAWDLGTGERAWTHVFARSHSWGPVLATAGGLVFAGGTNDRMFRAFDAGTGAVLWEFETGSGVAGVPVSFEVGGRQYVAVQSGWGSAGQRKRALLHRLLGYGAGEVPRDGAVWVFALRR